MFSRFLCRFQRANLLSDKTRQLHCIRFVVVPMDDHGILRNWSGDGYFHNFAMGVS